MVLAPKGFHVGNDGSEEWLLEPFFFSPTLPKTNTLPKKLPESGGNLAEVMSEGRMVSKIAGDGE